MSEKDDEKRNGFREDEERQMKAEKFIEDYLKDYVRFKDYWNYEDGCVLTGAVQMYEASGEEDYAAFVENYYKYFIMEDGSIAHAHPNRFNIDNINSGKALFFMYERTGEEKYRKALEAVMEQLREHPRCECGNFYHKEIYPKQIWLDGLYMAQPFYMEYETKYDKKEKYNDIIHQFENVQKYMYDEEKGLCYHGYDEAKTQFWADKKTGCSASFWLRSIGWYLMALVDVMDEMSVEIYEQYRKLEDIYRLVLRGILKYQDKESRLFYQVADRSDAEGNYTETSGSLMVAYSILKACRMGILLKEKYAAVGMDILERIVENRLEERDGKLHLTGICHAAGLGPEDNPVRDGSLAYYLSEKTGEDDPKAAGVLMMAYAQYIQLKREMERDGAL